MIGRASTAGWITTHYDNLREEGWKVESRALTTQRGFHRRCTTWSRARQERKGRENMVRNIVERALRQRTK